MPLIELEIPPGFKNHGTDLQSEGRWRTGNLVRWHDESLRPISGWVDRVGSAQYAAAPRGMMAWQDYSENRWIAAGTFDTLYVTTSGGTTSDITPAALTAGTEDGTVNTGYGGGVYGTGYYGQTRQASGAYSEATSWSLDTWGQYLVACSIADGRIFEWQLNTGTPAAVVSNAPTGCLGVLSTEERFLMALGAGGNPRKVAWSDFEDNTTWTAASTNQAGDIELQTSGQIMQGLRTQGQVLVLTDTDAHRLTYAGPPFVYLAERVGGSCGAISRHAAINTDAGAFWMGQRNFFLYNGSSVQKLPCDVWDHVFSDINTDQISKIWAVQNGQNGEVWWFYPSASSIEIDRYVAFDYRQGVWVTGEMGRTAGVDRGVFRNPIWADDGGTIYNHETGFNYDGLTPYAETGPFKIGEGERLAIVNSLIPDESNLGDVEATFKTRLYPTATETEHGPYSMANPTNVRLQGRQVRMRVDAVTPGDWRVGKFRLDVKQGSKR